MKSFSKVLAVVFVALWSANTVSAQVGGGNPTLGDEIVNAVTTAVPFLKIPPDARSGGMGDVGIATSPDANATFHNPAKLAFAEDPIGISVSYTPWLRNLVNDIYLAHVTGYYKINDKQAVAASLRYFSLGNITFTDVAGNETGQFRPNEFALDATYSRLLGGGFSTGLTLRFIFSNLATGQSVNGVNISPGLAAAADIAFYYNKPIKLKGGMNSTFAAGLVFSNIGSKITYTESSTRDFIPMNMGLGFSYELDIDEHNSIALALDLNRLLVPTPDTTDSDGNGVPDYREKSVPAAIFGSFGDAPGGFQEEMQEFNISTGIEYWYSDVLAVRFGYFWEHPLKGNRQFFTAGLGLRYSMFGLDFSYLIPTSSQRNPLDNTLRFSLLFNFSQERLDNRKKEAEPLEGSLPNSIRGL